MRASAAVFLAATLLAAGCSGEPGAGSAVPGASQRVGSQGGTAAPRVTLVTPTPPTAVAPLRRSAPVRVIMPTVGIDSRLMRLGIRRDGKLEVPPNGFPAGWFTGAPTPGERGPAVLAGHVHWARKDGVFARLARLKPGDRVVVERADGSSPAFRVVRVKHYPKTAFPAAAVYGNLDHAGLRLITCGGFDQATAKYEDNVVVFADLLA